MSSAVAAPTWHGTTTGYFRHRCPCDPCREAARVYTADLRARRHARRVIGSNSRPYAETNLRGEPLEHGRLATYREWGCRCDPCTYTNTATQQRAADRRYYYP